MGDNNYYYVWEFPDNLTTTDDTNDQDAIITTNQGFIRLEANEASTTNQDTLVPVKVKVVRAGCSESDFSDTLSVMIKAKKQLTIGNIATGDVFSTTDSPVTLTANETGGTFSGSGVSGNEFDPAKSGTGNKTITYTFEPAGGCKSSVSVSVLVSEPSGIPGLSSAYCKEGVNTNTEIDFEITQLQDISGANPSIIARYIVGLRPASGLSGVSGLILSTQPSCNSSQSPPSASAKLSYKFKPSDATPGEVKIEAYVVTLYNNLLSRDIGISGAIDLSGDILCSVAPLTLATINITSNPTPEISEANETCADGLTKYKYSVPFKPGNRYNWVVANGGSIAGSDTDREVEVIWDSTGTHNLKITETGEGCSGTDTIQVTVKAVPAPSVSGDSSVCAGAEATYKVTGGNQGDTYLWEIVNNKGVIAGSNTGDTVRIKWASENDTISVTVTNPHGCKKSAKLLVEVDALSAPGLTGPESTCANSTTTYAITPAPGATIRNWTVNRRNYSEYQQYHRKRR